MWGKKWKGIGMPASLPHCSEVATESKWAVQWVRCDVCLEEEKACECDKQTHVVSDHQADAGHRVAANGSFLHAVINMVGMVIGLGQLSTPYALEKGGWTSAFLMVGIGIICTYTSHLLGKCLRNNPKSRNYTDIGLQAFGSQGRAVAASFLYLEIFMSLVSYTISLHDNLSTVFMGTHLKLPWTHLSTSHLLTTMAVLVALPSLWLRDLSSISFLSTGGIAMSIVIFVSVACTAIFGGAKANHRTSPLHLNNIPAVSGLYIFSFTGHIVFPDLYKSMKNPSQFTKVSIVSFSLVIMLYTSLAFMGAKLFGPEVSPQVTLSMPRSLIITKIALWATVLTPMTKYALAFAPFALQLEHGLPHSMKPRTRMIVRGGVGSLLLLAILGLALSVPYFEHVLGLTGSLVSVGICMIFPCIFHMKIFWTHLSKPQLVLNVVLVTLGFLLGVSGTISSSKSLLQVFQRAHSA